MVGICGPGRSSPPFACSFCKKMSGAAQTSNAKSAKIDFWWLYWILVTSSNNVRLLLDHLRAKHSEA